ncbi:hypothetical protein O3P69_000345 [Scylla paramamosain]|uniref:Uncharacterized protein n=1 Tax=Scylla paramamosain TaxID=85552 RepID=A0AAW0V0U1_SCYPA
MTWADSFGTDLYIILATTLDQLGGTGVSSEAILERRWGRVTSIRPARRTGRVTSIHPARRTGRVTSIHPARRTGRVICIHPARRTRG